MNHDDRPDSARWRQPEPSAGDGRGGAPVYPRMPRVPAAGGPVGRGGDPRPKVAVVALLAGLLGALLGSGAAVVAVDTRRADPAASQPVAVPSAATPGPAEQVREALGQTAAATDGEPGRDAAAAASEAGPRDRVAVVARAVLPTVVQVDIEGGGVRGRGVGNGSGVVYRSDGYIVTNYHVVAGGGDLSVVFADGSRSDAEVVGTDRESDVAVLRVDRTGLVPIDIGDSDRLEVGELAVAIGSPFGLEGSVTAGVISALNRPIVVGGPEGQPVQLPNVIQTDAPINPGNSGGALVSGDGRLIGINSAILTSGTPANAGVGFAVPVNIVVAVADDLIADGFVRYPLIGVVGQSVPPEMAARLQVDAGALVTEVARGTPAEQAGLAADDVIVALDGEEITSFSDLVLAVRRSEVGDTVTVRYIRDGQQETVDITLVERPR